MSQIRKIKTLDDLLIKSWFKYDKAITAVLRTMGYNSVKRYIDANEHEKNYFRIAKGIKSKPKDGTVGILNSVKQVVNSERFKTLIWIENNVQKYLLKKEGSDSIDSIVEQFISKFKSIEQIPGVLKVETDYSNLVDMNGNNVVGDKNKFYLTLKIYYDQTIKYIPKNRESLPYTIKLNADPITQLIPIEIVDIDLDLIYKNQFETIFNSLINEDLLRDSFKFSGPCMFTQGNRNGTPAHGCLGDRDDEYREIVKEASLIRYVSFISTWSSVYNQGRSHPYRNPGSLISNYKVRGYSANTPKNVMKEDDCHVPNITITERKEWVAASHYGKRYVEWCKNCSFTECNKNLLNGQTVKEITEEIKQRKLNKYEKKTFRRILLHFVNKHGIYFEWSNFNVCNTEFKSEYINAIKHLVSDSRNGALESQLYNYAITDINWVKTHNWINKKMRKNND